ncbi:hypothetical protein CC78DRAFT_592746 [Lojkania enalia]|uniref:Uncharacterized protein n=1 Tax=Lojkania enalia TaxID=147567 RepID=A0A9P4N6H1_9PLEO|nr:hypothetical protein CC78DRAFT_592746 [Didymosphaeria enalia]
MTKCLEHIIKLREELDPFIINSDTEISSDGMARLGHLNRAINESLRLYTGVPTAIYRKVPAEGITIDITNIPRNTNILCLRYGLGRSNFD